MALKIGLTGGIASGKSATQAEFQRLGASVVDADQVARELVEPGTPALAEIVARFGPSALDGDGRLDRRRMRERVFSDPLARRALESILHPAIRETLQRRSAAVTRGYVVLAIPLLVESGRYAWIDRVLVVDLPVAIQIERVRGRDRVGHAEAEAIIAAQATRGDRLAAADDVIINDGSLDALRAAVERLDRRYRQLPDPPTP